MIGSSWLALAASGLGKVGGLSLVTRHRYSSNELDRDRVTLCFSYAGCKVIGSLSHVCVSDVSGDFTRSSGYYDEKNEVHELIQASACLVPSFAPFEALQ
ncbi:hypothetical protein GGS21DRAFT_61785 [Xylaria nigripes]|nr:hypothetical protein GGS21DRAFT_61785 [Xylaria nigripes]